MASNLKKLDIINSIKEIKNAAYSGELREIANKLDEHGFSFGIKSIEEIIPDCLDRINARMESKARPGLRTGLIDLDYLTGDGFNPGLFVFAGNFFAKSQNQGQSELALCIACRVALNKHKESYFSTGTERTLDFINYYEKHGLKIRTLRLCHCDELSFETIAPDIRKKELIVIDKANVFETKAYNLGQMARKNHSAVIAVTDCDEVIREEPGKTLFFVPLGFKKYADTIFRFYKKIKKPGQVIDVISVTAEKNRHGPKNAHIYLGHYPETYRFVDFCKKYS
ncbi:hypothetical protein JW851_02015 [Candidatus Woesearchaeota archaeon]|nr:hypothetical protein [Candidatus Woesearchaeota archaeon]